MLCFASSGVHQVALLTHVDRVCPATGGDASRVYESRVLQDAVRRSRLCSMKTAQERRARACVCVCVSVCVCVCVS